MADPERSRSRGNAQPLRARWMTPTPEFVPIAVGETEILVPRRFVGAYLSGLLR